MIVIMSLSRWTEWFHLGNKTQQMAQLQLLGLLTLVVWWRRMVVVFLLTFLLLLILFFQCTWLQPAVALENSCSGVSTSCAGCFGSFEKPPITAWWGEANHTLPSAIPRIHLFFLLQERQLIKKILPFFGKHFVEVAVHDNSNEARTLGVASSIIVTARGHCTLLETGKSINSYNWYWLHKPLTTKFLVWFQDVWYHRNSCEKRWSNFNNWL